MSVDGVDMDADHVMRVLATLPLPLRLVLCLLQRFLWLETDRDLHKDQIHVVMEWLTILPF